MLCLLARALPSSAFSSQSSAESDQRKHSDSANCSAYSISAFHLRYLSVNHRKVLTSLTTAMSGVNATSSLLPTRLHAAVEHGVLCLLCLALGLLWFIHGLHIVLNKPKPQLAVRRQRRRTRRSLSPIDASSPRESRERQNRSNSRSRHFSVSPSPDRPEDEDVPPAATARVTLVSEVDYIKTQVCGQTLLLDQVMILVLSVAAMAADLTMTEWKISEAHAAYSIHASMWAFLALGAGAGTGLVAVHRTVQYSLYVLAFGACAMLQAVLALGEGLGGVSTLHACTAFLYLCIAITMAMECSNPSSTAFFFCRAVLFILGGVWSGVSGAIICVQYDKWPEWKGNFWQRTMAVMAFSWTVWSTVILVIVISYSMSKMAQHQSMRRSQERRASPLVPTITLQQPSLDQDVPPATAAGQPSHHKPISPLNILPNFFSQLSKQHRSSNVDSSGSVFSRKRRRVSSSRSSKLRFSPFSPEAAQNPMQSVTGFDATRRKRSASIDIAWPGDRLVHRSESDEESLPLMDMTDEIEDLDETTKPGSDVFKNLWTSFEDNDLDKAQSMEDCAFVANTGSQDSLLGACDMNSLLTDSMRRKSSTGQVVSAKNLSPT